MHYNETDRPACQKAEVNAQPPLAQPAPSPPSGAAKAAAAAAAAGTPPATSTLAADAAHASTSLQEEKLGKGCWAQGVQPRGVGWGVKASRGTQAGLSQQIS